MRRVGKERGPGWAHRRLPCLVLSFVLLGCGTKGGGQRETKQNLELQRLWTLAGAGEANQALLLPDTEYAVDFAPIGAQPPDDPSRRPMRLEVGCNTCTGSYATDLGQEIDILVDGCTVMNCDPLPQWATDFPEWLQQAGTYELIGSTLTVRCGDAESPSSAQTLSFVDTSRVPLGTVPLSRGSSSGITTERFAVATDEPSWAALWAEHCPQGACGEPLPVVDFATSQVIGLFAGERPSSGYDIGVDGVVERRDGTHVDVTLQVPGDGCVVAAVMTTPYAFVRVPLLPSPVTFQVEPRGVACR